MAEINEMNSSPESGKRLFLACWPDQSLQELLYDLARHLQLKHGGRRTERENIHLTLVFLGQVHQEKEQLLRQQLRLLDVKQFELELDQTGSFTHCRLNWVGPTVLPAGLKALHAILKRISQELGFRGENGSYIPHVSLLRDSRSEDGHSMKPMQWKVNKYCLIESKNKRDGVEYKIIEEFPLAELKQ